MKYESPQISAESKSRVASGKLPKRKAPYQGRTRLYIAECERCSELLAEYISAGNAVVDLTRSHLNETVLASEIKKQRKIREDARKSLLTHKRGTH